MSVFVLDKHHKQLMPCSNKRASILLRRGRARVHKLVPFTIRLVDRLQKDSVLQDLTVKIDPGSKGTGMSLVRETDVVEYPNTIFRHVHIIKLFELWHRGLQIHLSMQDRRNHRRFRRTRLRYRPARFDNRTKPDGWLAPSLQHRVDNIVTWVKRLMNLSPVSRVVVESVSFDTRKMKDPTVKGKQYQRGPLYTKTLRSYLMDKHQSRCFYCGDRTTHLEQEHIVPKSKGGVDSINNLVLACRQCNISKGTRSIQDYLKDKPEVFERLQNHFNTTYKDAAVVNSTKTVLINKLRQLVPDVEMADGYTTYENRLALNIAKMHCLDSVCVGFVSKVINLAKQSVLSIWSMGRGRYQRTILNKYGFPRAYLPRVKQVFGYQTGDLVKAIVTNGEKVGTYIGRVAVRSRGYFNIKTNSTLIQELNHKYFQRLQYSDGYQYVTTQIA